MLNAHVSDKAAAGLTVRTVGCDGHGQFLQSTDADGIDSAHKEHVRQSLLEAGHDQTRVRRQGQLLPGHAQGFALLDDVAGDVTSSVVLRRRPRETPRVIARSRLAHGDQRRRFVCGESG